MKLIVASATMDAKGLCNFFNAKDIVNNQQKDTAVIMSVQGRQYPVNIYYVKGTIIFLCDDRIFVSKQK